MDGQCINCHEFGNHCRCDDEFQPCWSIYPSVCAEDRRHSMVWSNNADVAYEFAKYLSGDGTKHSAFLCSVPDGVELELIGGSLFVKRENDHKSLRTKTIQVVEQFLKGI